jgi:hypothetical protein
VRKRLPKIIKASRRERNEYTKLSRLTEWIKRITQNYPDQESGKDYQNLFSLTGKSKFVDRKDYTVMC